MRHGDARQVSAYIQHDFYVVCAVFDAFLSPSELSLVNMALPSPSASSGLGLSSSNFQAHRSSEDVGLQNAQEQARGLRLISGGNAWKNGRHTLMNKF